MLKPLSASADIKAAGTFGLTQSSASCGRFTFLNLGLSALQVQSVDSHKGMLTGCCAASHDRTIAVYPANVVPGEVAKHKAVWQAHGRTITALHANRFCPTLLSGDDAGQIYM